MHLVHNVLPSGKNVQYIAAEGDEIPTIPAYNENMSESALTATMDTTFVEEDQSEAGRGRLPVPYVEAARSFFLPQWVAFDDQHHLLVGDLNEAIASIIAMKRYLSVLQAAVGLAPYMVADEEYQRKRYGILGQLVNQGRALASYEVEEIIRTIKRRAASHDLDRGLSLSLPYFNDQTLALETYRFDVIPVGRVMFVPAFVVLAVRAQGAKVAQDTCINRSTRRHLLIELGTLEETFLR
jgi:GNAT superfamily N-acetyltransferase